MPLKNRAITGLFYYLSSFIKKKEIIKVYSGGLFAILPKFWGNRSGNS